MSTVTLRIPVSKTLYDKAEAVSLSHGFSLEEMVKILLRKLTKKEVTVASKEEEVVHLSKRAEKRYAKIFEDMKTGKSVYEAKDINDFIAQLERA